MSNIDNLTNKDLDNIIEMLENYLLVTKHTKNTLDRNYNYSNILDYLNHVRTTKRSIDETSLTITYETH